MLDIRVLYPIYCGFLLPYNTHLFHFHELLLARTFREPQDNPLAGGKEMRMGRLSVFDLQFSALTLLDLS
jgi:hypothetical protein